MSDTRCFRCGLNRNPTNRHRCPHNRACENYFDPIATVTTSEPTCKKCRAFKARQLKLFPEANVGERVTCPECGETFSSQAKLNGHKSRHAKRMSGRRQYNFIDMLGKRIGALVVVAEAPTVNGNVRWRCACDCGGEIIVEGIQLRGRIKNGRAHFARCGKCQPKRPGTVIRGQT